MAMLSHRQGWSLALVASLFPCVFITGSANDAPLATYHTGASEVRVTFFATDQNNQLVDTVLKDDFAVVDSGMVIRDFRSLMRSNETALDVVAVVDASESVAPRFHTAMNDVLQLVSERPLASDDNISVVSFDGLRPVLLCTRDCRSPAAGQRLLAVKAAGPTPLFDALAYAANFSSGRRVPGVRQALILFSDGNDTISMTSARDALQAITASGALLYTVDLNESADASTGSIVLQRMADATGGRSFSVHEGAINVLQAALADLRASYVVTYPLPSRVAGFHSLRILPKHNLNLRFHCRSGYYYEDRIP
ncbi:MAG: VWA domain-containing protein [Terriglobales bacterium]